MNGIGRLLPAPVLALLAGCGPQFVAPTGVEVAPRLTETALVAADGVALPLARWTPEGSVEGVVLALHSFGDFRLAFEGLGPWLAERGQLVVAYDQRGFGEAPAQGRWWGTERMVEDARTAIGLLRAAHPDLPLALLGESMGGAVAMIAAASNPDVYRLVLAAPAVRDRLPYRWAWDLGFSTAASVWPGYTRTVDHTTAAMTETASERLGQDPRVVREVRVDTYWGLLQLANAASAVPPDQLPPTLLLFGTEDETVPDVSLCVLTAGLDADDAVRVDDGAGHRLLHERAARDVRADILAWLQGRPLSPAEGVTVARVCDAVG